MAYSKLPSLDNLSQLFVVDGDNGMVFWKIGKCKSKEAGFIKSNGYKVITINNTNYYSHRIIYYYCVKEDISNLMIDHIDGDKLNNKISNLRSVNSMQNQLARSKQKFGKTISQERDLKKLREKWGR